MKKYSIIYADPPWGEYVRKNGRGTAEGHFNTLSLDELKRMKIKYLTTENSYLFLWVTFPLLQQGLDVIKSWGFIYKTIAFNWLKYNKNANSFFFGIGKYTRSNSEICLLGIKGEPKVINHSISQVIVSEFTQHSSKPKIIRRKIIDLCGDLPRIELFHRGGESVEGWDLWGNESDSLNTVNLDIL